MKALILTYHSHHVLAGGGGYGSNDHVAFPLDLDALTRAGFLIVPLGELVEQVRRRGFLRSMLSRESKIVSLTFDDGPEYDAVDFDHPVLGPQRSFLRAMFEFRDSSVGHVQREISATSFVIASPAARLAMETSFDPAYTFLEPGAMNDRWWSTAIDSKILTIANHSWDHLHPALPSVAHSRQAKADFTQVDNQIDGDAQINQAARFIGMHTGGKDAPFFAYPFGHYNDYLVNSYLPDNAKRNNLSAAFTTGGRRVVRSDNVWCLPRYTCGHHWKSPKEFEALLEAA